MFFYNETINVVCICVLVCYYVVCKLADRKVNNNTIVCIYHIIMSHGIQQLKGYYACLFHDSVICINVEFIITFYGHINDTQVS